MSSLDLNSIDASDFDLNKYFSPIFSLFACPFCSQRDTYVCQNFKPSRLNFSCSKGDPCCSTLTSPHFFAECLKQSIEIKVSRIVSSSLPTKPSRRSRKITKKHNSFSRLLPESPLDVDSWGESVQTNEPIENYDEAIFQFSSEIGSPEIALEDTYVKDILNSNKMLASQMKKLHEINERLLVKLQLLENSSHLDSYSPALPSYNQHPTSQALGLTLTPSSRVLESSDGLTLRSFFSSPALYQREHHRALQQGKGYILFDLKRLGASPQKMSPRANAPSFPTGATTACIDQNEPRGNIGRSSSNFFEDNSEESDILENIEESKRSEPVASESPEGLCSINYIKGTINPSRLQRAEHSCKKLELGALNQKGGSKSKREDLHKLAAVEIDGILRQPFKAIKNQLREIGIVAEITPSLHFISSRALEIIIPHFYLDEFISLILSQKSSNNKLFKNWKIISVQKISL